MAQTLPKMVTAKSGAQYDAASPQGQMIVNAAKPAFDSDSKILASIATNVISIGEGVSAMVMIAQADARGDALNKSNVVQDDLTPPAAVGMSDNDLAAQQDENATLGGLGGLAGMIGSLGKGLTFWGPAGPGVVVFTAFLLALTATAVAGAFAFRKAAGPIAEGMETLSDADVDPEKVIQMGKALAAFGAAMGVSGLGTALQGLGGLVGGIADGLAGFLGIEGKDPMVALKAFSEHKFTEDEVKQIGLNAKALTEFSAAMTIAEVGGAVQSIANLVSGVADGMAGLFPEGKDPMLEMKKFAGHKFTDDEVKQIKTNALALVGFSTAIATTESIGVVTSIAKLASGVVNFAASFFPEGKDPMIEMKKFAGHKFTTDDVKQIGLNSLALVGFSTTMASVENIGVVEDIANLASGVVNFASSFFPKGKDPMIEMKKFAGHKFTEDDVKQIELNARGLLAFSSTMGVAKTMGAVGDVTGLFGGIANGISSLFGLEKKDPMADMKLFAKEKITEDEVKQIELNAKGLVAFSKAMALYSASGAAADALDLVGNIASGITSFFGGTKGIDYEEIKTFAAADLQVDKITSNALALSTFATAMSTMASDKVGVEWKNIGANILGAIGGFFGGDANATMMKNFDAIDEFTARTLDLATVENNISAINRFMEFGQSWVGFEGGDFDGVSDFAEGLVRSANGIHTAMYGGTYVKGGFNMKIKDGKGLAGVELMDMTNAGMGIAVLRHSLTNNAPLQELRAVSAEMSASTGAVTVIAPTDSSITTTSSTTTAIEAQATARQAATDAFMYSLEMQ